MALSWPKTGRFKWCKTPNRWPRHRKHTHAAYLVHGRLFSGGLFCRRGCLVPLGRTGGLLLITEPVAEQAACVRHVLLGDHLPVACQCGARASEPSITPAWSYFRGNHIQTGQTCVQPPRAEARAQRQSAPPGETAGCVAAAARKRRIQPEVKSRGKTRRARAQSRRTGPHLAGGLHGAGVSPLCCALSRFGIGRGRPLGLGRGESHVGPDQCWAGWGLGGARRFAAGPRPTANARPAAWGCSC